MLLDTTVYSALARGIQPAVDAIDGVSELVIPLPAIAELRYGFLQGSQADRNENTLEKFLAQPHIVVAAPTIATTRVYAELQHFCMQRGKALSQNDLWIAALAREAGDTLITFDKDFNVFSNLFGEKLLILN